jgi:hypothetical protein
MKGSYLRGQELSSSPRSKSILFSIIFACGVAGANCCNYGKGSKQKYLQDKEKFSYIGKL